MEVREVVRLWSQGESLRSISRLTGLDLKTVRRYVKAAQQVDAPPVGEETEEGGPRGGNRSEERTCAKPEAESP